MPKGAPAECLEVLRFATSQPDISLSEIDEHMGWETGRMLGLVKKYPRFKEDLKECKILAMRSVGLEKVGAYKVYKEAMEAERSLAAGEDVVTEPDHKTRVMAADRVMALYGEKVTGGSSMSVAVGVQVMLTVEEKAELDELRRRVG